MVQVISEQGLHIKYPLGDLICMYWFFNLGQGSRIGIITCNFTTKNRGDSADDIPCLFAMV